jgi:hypothetical protein
MEPRRLRNQWALKSCYRDSFVFFLMYLWNLKVRSYLASYWARNRKSNCTSAPLVSLWTTFEVVSPLGEPWWNVLNMKANKVIKIAKDSKNMEYSSSLCLFFRERSDKGHVSLAQRLCRADVFDERTVGLERLLHRAVIGTFSCLISHFSVIGKRSCSYDLLMESINFLLLNRASVKRIVSLQVLNQRQSVGLLGRGISPT